MAKSQSGRRPSSSWRRARADSLRFLRGHHGRRVGGRAALAKVKAIPRGEIADVLLDQAIFAGVGNIIKNEVLFRVRVSPFAKIGDISDRKLKAVVADARTFSFRFLELRRAFSLRKNLEVYRRSVCPRCGGKIERRVHGQRARRSFFCPRCQGVRISGSSRTPKRRSGSGTRYWYRPSTRCSRPATSSTAARAIVNRRVSPASA